VVDSSLFLQLSYAEHIAQRGNHEIILVSEAKTSAKTCQLHTDLVFTDLVFTDLVFTDLVFTDLVFTDLVLIRRQA
jgi:hypothetical protein